MPYNIGSFEGGKVQNLDVVSAVIISRDGITHKERTSSLAIRDGSRLIVTLHAITSFALRIVDKGLDNQKTTLSHKRLERRV